MNSSHQAARGLQRAATAVVIVVVVVFLATFATIGYFERNPLEGQTYPLLIQLIQDAPGRVGTVFGLAALGYVVAFLGVRYMFSRELARSEQAVPGTTRPGRFIRWVVARWWRVSLLLAIVWSPIFLMQAPGFSTADLIMQSLEVLADRSQLGYPPFDVYPTGHYLIPNGDILLSNHHNVVLTLLYGNTLGLSANLFGTFKPGFLLLTSTQVLFTLIAFGRSTQLLTRWVRSDRIALLGMVVLIGGGVPLAYWSMSVSKTPLFAAAFVWWLALSVDFARSRGPIRKRQVLELLLLTIVVLISAKFALYLVAAQIVVLIIARRGWPSWRVVLVSLALPTIVFQVALRGSVAAGWVIPSDPLAGQGLQIQTMALTLKENPDALSDDAKARLDKIFDVDLMTENYEVRSMGPIRGAGYRDGAYRWKVVTADEVSEFGSIWQELIRRDPVGVTDGVLFKAHKFFDPLARGGDNWPGVERDDSVSAVKINGLKLSDDGTNDRLRHVMEDFTVDVSETPVLRLWLEAPLRVALAALIALVALSLRRPSTWVWALPIGLHAGVLAASPLSNSGRYALGITYALPFMILALAGSIRPWSEDEAAGSEPLADEGSSSRENRTIDGSDHAGRHA